MKIKGLRKKNAAVESVSKFDIWSRIIWPGLFVIFFAGAPLIVFSGYTPAGQIFFSAYDLPKISFITAFIALCSAFYCIYIYRNPAYLESSINFMYHNQGVKITIILLVVMILSIPGSLVLKVGIYHLVYYVLLAVLAFILAQLFQQKRLRQIAVYALLLGALIFVGLGLIQMTSYKLPFLKTILGPASTFGYRNPAAHFIAMIIPFVFFVTVHHWYCWRQSRMNSQLVFFVALLLFFVALLILLFANYSRAAIMALLAEAVVVPLFWFFSRKKVHDNSGNWRQNWLKLLVVTVFLLIVISCLIMAFPKSRQRVERSFHKFKRGGVARLLEARYYHWGNSLMMIKDHPVSGVGLGNWRFNYPLYYKSFAKDPLYNYRMQVRKAHNDYLQLAAECGIPALLLFLLLWGRQFYLLRYDTTADDDGEDWRLPILASLTAFSVIMFFSFPMQMVYSRMFCFFLLALGEARAWPALSR